MSRCPKFLQFARWFSNSLLADKCRGIATERCSIKYTYDTLHKPTLDMLLPVSSYPISYNEYMQGMMQATNNEVIDFLSFLRDSGMYVVDPIALNRNESFFTRIPPDPALRMDYDFIRTNASVSTMIDYAAQTYNEASIGLGSAFYDNAKKFRWSCAWVENTAWINSAARPMLPWDEFVALQEVRAVQYVVEGAPNRMTMSKTPPWYPGALVHFIGDNEKAIECFGGTSRIPDSLYNAVAKSFVKLKDYDGFVFSREHREQNVVADFEANLRMRAARGDRILMLDEEIKFQDVVTKHQTQGTVFRFE